MERIYLVHLSDVHIGSSAYNNPIWTKLRKLVANGHDNALVDELMVLWKDQQLQLRLMLQQSGAPFPNDELHVLVTGDLTRTGSTKDFKLSWDFFSGTWSAPPSGTELAGLNLKISNSNLPAVPGNHDQWGGGNMWSSLTPAGYNPAGFRNTFGRTDWQNPMTIRQGALKVEIYGVDSNSGLPGNGFSPFQGGAINKTELQRLERELTRSGPSAPQTLRIVLCHHGFDHVGPFLRPLDVASRDELLRIASDHGISVVLTGHSHYAFSGRWTTPLKTKSLTPKGIWEVRGTTPLAGPATPSGNLQAGAFPGNRTECHGFYVHEISVDSPSASPKWLVHAILLIGGAFTYCGTKALSL